MALDKAHRMLSCPLDGNRRTIMGVMEGRGEMNVTEIEILVNKSVRMPQTCVSMAILSLAEHGYLNVRREGKYRYYSINVAHIEKVNRIVTQLITHPEKIMV